MSFGKIRLVFSLFLTFRRASGSHHQGRAISADFSAGYRIWWRSEERSLDLFGSGQCFTHGGDVESGFARRVQNDLLAPRHQIDGGGEFVRLVGSENHGAMPICMDDVTVR